MHITTVLFDLDGTLLPMDQDAFLKVYFQSLSAYMARFGYEPKPLIEALWAGINAMIKNNGLHTNEEAFWQVFSGMLGPQVADAKPALENFYRTEFANARIACRSNSQAADTIARLKKAGMRTVLATNPLFPRIATESRIRWAGLQPDDFMLYTTYENSSFSKPNPDYYREILRRLDVRPEECLMIGNDVDEDMVAETLGLKVFLLTDCLINQSDRDISIYPHGDFSALHDFITQTIL